MHRARALKIMGVVIATLLITNGALLSYAQESLSDILQRDGKLKLIIKFKDFVSDRIALKMAESELVIDGELNEYILRKIDEKYNLKKLKKLFRDREIAQTTGGYAREFDNYFVIEIDKDESYAEWVCERLQRFYEVDMVEVDVEMSIEAYPLPNVDYIPDDYYVASGSYWRTGAWGQSYPNMWGLQKTQTFEAWDLFSNARTDPGEDIVVAVIDTGVNYNHSDVSGNMWRNPGEIAGNGRDDDGNGYVDDIYGWDFTTGGGGSGGAAVTGSDPMDRHGHGTHCSGTIAAVTNNTRGVAGIAPNAKIRAVKGLSDSGSGYISWLSNCIVYAANNGAHVLSNSWGGGGSSSTLTNAVNYAHSRGCVIIAAAGNSNRNVSGFIPASIPKVIAVAATDHNDIKAYFSNYGAMIDVSAPGVSILSSTGSGYASWSGTSMACPHVSGVAALIRSYQPDITNAEVRQRLTDTADDIDNQNPSYRGLLGAGRINAYQAILAGGPQPHAPVLNPIGNKVVNEGETLSFTISATDEDGDALIYAVYNELPGGLQNIGDSDFFIQSGTVYTGSKALQSGAVETNEFSTVTKSVSLSADGTASFYWKVSSASGSGELEFYIDDITQATITGDVDWQEKSFSLASGSHTLKWSYTRSEDDVAGEDAGWIDNISVTSGGTTTYNFEDGQMPAGFTTGGDGSFYVQSGVAHGGSFSLKADSSIVDNESEYVQKTVVTSDGASLSFWWKVSSEYYYDFLEFYIDGVLKHEISGSTSWAKKTYTLSAGTHTLKWQYTKDYSVTHYQDTGWVDDIVIDDSSEETIGFEAVSGQPNPLPDGASFDANTRTFIWTPTYQQSGTYPGIRFTVTEDTEEERSDSEDVTITVRNVNRPPVLDSIGDKIVNEMELLEFTISASDPEGDELIYAASNLPVGAIFDTDTQTFSWIPTYQQSGVYQNVHFEVGDRSSGGGGNDENTKLLLHCDGTEGSSDFLDSSFTSYIITPHGAAHIDTSVNKWGTGSLKLDGDSDYLTIPDSDDWDVSGSNTDNWTIDFWVKHTDHTGVEYYIQHAGNGKSWRIYHKDGEGIIFLIGGHVIDTGYGGEITDTDWHHMALCKVGSEYAIYKDGTQVNYVDDNSTATFTSNLYIGRRDDNHYYFNGHMDEIRICKGNFFNASPNRGLTDTITPPTGEH